MSSVSLPVLPLPLRAQKYSCHGCGVCCRDFTVQLRAEDLKKLDEQKWASLLGEPVTIEFRGVHYLRQRDDGSCTFLMPDGLCRIHREFGFEAKPIACQLFPFHITPQTKGLSGGLNFACQSVQENKGAELKSHASELSRMAGELRELNTTAQPPLLAGKSRASLHEEQSLVRHVDDWLADHEIAVPQRLDGLAFVAQMLAKANFERVREERFGELLDVLFDSMPEELELHPLEPPTARQRTMLRQAVFARTEDPKLNVIARQGRVRTTLAQLSRNRRFKSGRGLTRPIGEGWHAANLADVGRIAPASELEHRRLIDDLLTRWIRATVLGGRAWGAGYYGWSMVDGVQNLVLNAACVGWLARLHAAGESRRELTIDDVRAALGRIDRTAGRAKWLGSSAERLRLAYLNMDDGLRRLLAAHACTTC